MMRGMSRLRTCARCGREGREGDAYCPGCGALSAGPPAEPLGGCAACRAPLIPGARFCSQCGAPAAARRAPATPSPPLLAPSHARPGRRAAAEGPRLTVVRADGQAGAVHPLNGAEAVCGRTEGSIRVGDDPAVSPRHARFTLREGVLSVEDLGSLNGTFLRIRAPCRLGVGAELRVGRQLLRLEPRASAPPPAPGARPFGAEDPGSRFRLSQLLEDGGLGEIFPLAEGENAVGREAGRVTFPADRYVSARHARLLVKGEVVTLEDVGSSNGTFVRLSGPARLAPGDQLLVGAQLLRVET